MKTSKTKTVRFASVVAACGSPEIASLWSSPQQNKPFLSAVEQNRVLSIKQETVGSKKDFGVVGFLREKNVSYLVFPKRLNAFENNRVVGIRYDLIKTPGPVGAPLKSGSHKKSARRKRAGIIQQRWEKLEELELVKKPGKCFKVTLRFAVEIDVVDEVKAETRKAAVEIAEGRARIPDFSKATITRRIVRVVRG